MRSVGSSEEVRAEDAWLACGTCEGLVNEDDREALVLRSAQDALLGIAELFNGTLWLPRDRARS